MGFESGRAGEFSAFPTEVHRGEGCKQLGQTEAERDRPAMKGCAFPGFRLGTKPSTAKQLTSKVFLLVRRRVAGQRMHAGARARKEMGLCSTRAGLPWRPPKRPGGVAGKERRCGLHLYHSWHVLKQGPKSGNDHRGRPSSNQDVSSPLPSIFTRPSSVLEAAAEVDGN